jgi:hypothetical protein
MSGARITAADRLIFRAGLRASQFHELMQLTLRAMAKLPVIPASPVYLLAPAAPY